MVSWKIVKPRLVRITFIWKTSEVSCYYSLLFICKIKLWNLNLVVILCKLSTWPPIVHVSLIWMQSLSNVFLVQYDQKSVSRLFIVILLHSVVEYSLNQFPCHRHVFFLWKPWTNKLVTLCSHDHFQFELHLISQIYHSIDPEHFSGETCLQKKSKNWFQLIFKSLNAIVSFYTDKLFCSHRIFPGFSLDVPTFQCKAAFSSVRKLLWVHWKFEMNLISVESNKMWQNISKICHTHFAFNCQLSA